RDDSKNTLYLQ
nr:immunoglobulin heavy chain junction region [Homo sapiens]